MMWLCCFGCCNRFWNVVVGVVDVELLMIGEKSVYCVGDFCLGVMMYKVIVIVVFIFCECMVFVVFCFVLLSVDGCCWCYVVVLNLCWSFVLRLLSLWLRLCLKNVLMFGSWLLMVNLLMRWLLLLCFLIVCLFVICIICDLLMNLMWVGLLILMFFVLIVIVEWMSGIGSLRYYVVWWLLLDMLKWLMMLIVFVCLVGLVMNF